MDFYAEQINQFPTLSYIAMVGDVFEDLDKEVIKRVGRIDEASPEKKRLALDVRGINRLEPEHFQLFETIQNELETMGWELYFCNIPKRFENFFSSGRVRRELNVFASKQELFQHLASSTQSGSQETSDDTAGKSVRERSPIPITLSTREGVRLFEGFATDLDSSRILRVLTDDDNAAAYPPDSNHELQLIFNSQALRMAPPSVNFKSCTKTNGDEKNYAVLVELNDLDAQQKTLLEEYFGIVLN